MARLLSWVAVALIAACGFVGAAMSLTGHESLGILLLFITSVGVGCWMVYDRFANRNAKPS